MKKLLAKVKTKKGFTLIEMLIVVAIIAVLAAILIPTVSTSLTKSKEAADIANLRSVVAEAEVKMLTDSTYNLSSALTDIKAVKLNKTNQLTVPESIAEGTKFFNIQYKSSTLEDGTNKSNSSSDKYDIYEWTLQDPDLE